ncbi:ferric reductase-like transmembrane domain-containing protein [Heyndrickxia ginsengihumi]|uniref:ferric reductase-like transmembrane domain-containing protein n=1 Tax=Heyndrickxia ginsengihumi TaxID=363870 RepID=UPI00046E98BC|nr:ferric reductase-like transmembrane domain-containing protein [Heyndrickxia ginsengihumi]
MNELLNNIHHFMPVWTVSRAAGITSYLLLFVSVMTGMSAHYHFMKAKTKARMNLIHQSTGWFGMLFGMTHGLILIFSTYQSFSILEVIIPFASKTHPLLIGIGTLALYVMIILIVTSDYMKVLGRKTWKTIHFLAFPAFISAFFHSVLLGPDSHYPFMMFLYCLTAIITVVALICRIAVRPPKKELTSTQK